MIVFDSVEFVLEFVDVSLVQSLHLLHLQVEGLDFLVFGVETSLQVAFFVHELFHVDVPGLQQGVVLNVGQGGLRGVDFYFLLALCHHVLEFSLYLVVGHCYFRQSQFVVFAQIQSVLHFACESFSGFFEQVSEFFGFLGVVGVAVLELVAQTVEVGFVEFADFDFGEFYFPFVVFNDVSDFVFEFVVVFLNQLQSLLFVLFQISVNVEQSLSLSLFGVDDVLQNGDLVFVELSQVVLSLHVGVAFVGELLLVEGCQFLHSSSVEVIVVLEFVSERGVVVDESGDFGLAFLSCFFESVAGFFDFVFLLFDFVSESFNFSLVQVFEFVFVLLVNSDEVVFVVFELSFDEVDFLFFLFFQFLQFVFVVGLLSVIRGTSFLSSSFLSRICLLRFSISKFF